MLVRVVSEFDLKLQSVIHGDEDDDQEHRQAESGLPAELQYEHQGTMKGAAVSQENVSRHPSHPSIGPSDVIGSAVVHRSWLDLSKQREAEVLGHPGFGPCSSRRSGSLLLNERLLVSGINAPHRRIY